MKHVNILPKELVCGKNNICEKYGISGASVITLLLRHKDEDNICRLDLNNNNASNIMLKMRSLIFFDNIIEPLNMDEFLNNMHLEAKVNIKSNDVFEISFMEELAISENICCNEAFFVYYLLKCKFCSLDTICKTINIKKPIVKDIVNKLMDLNMVDLYEKGYRSTKAMLDEDNKEYKIKLKVIC